MSKQKVLSLTRNDFRWDYYRGTGKGGQKKNKTDNCCRCTHEPSGAVGKAEDGRSKDDNRKLAFDRMSKTKEFQQWLKLETSRKMGILDKIEEKVNKEITFNTKIEKKENGKWVDYNKDTDEE